MFDTVRKSRRRGFTLLEILVVIALIAILALMIIPRLVLASRRAREATLKANLSELRGAIARFEGDVGIYPGLLQDLVAPSGADLSSHIPDDAQKNYKGPYLSDTGGIPISGFMGLPVNPFVPASDADETHHWTYSSPNGEVSCPATVEGTSLDGVPYTDL
ncbi:MAG: type II secretion system protein [Armatimonadota bacterium]